MNNKGFGYTTRFLTKDGQPWFPMMGEMHFSRYREDLWEESLRKIKACGVSIVATYIFWLHHEEEEGVLDFSGCRNLGKFVKLCHKVGLYVFLRLGPWCHGEARNGGFPDWLMTMGPKLRTNDPAYLQLVECFWRQIFNQVRGTMYPDGGPVIGIQIENEYGHVGGQNGEVGDEHMRTLAALAREIGFNAPIYTATGWGGAMTGGLLPVMGGYCEAPWDPRLTEIEANENYIFTRERNDTNIASDHHKELGLTFDPDQFPYLTAELGGGLQVTHHRRPVASGADIGAMSLVKLGSGVGLLGYYMFHGGSNPKGKFTTLQESSATGYPNDLPEINYDFNAPIRQYGQISDSYKELKLLGLFLQDFGSDVTALADDIEPKNVRPEDMETLRLSWRHNERGGYVFFSNYQRRRQMAEHTKVTLNGRCEEPVMFPEITIRSGEYGFFPYHMQLGDAMLVSALATPLCQLEGINETRYVFYGDRDPKFCWKDDRKAKVLHISRNDALNAWKVTLDQDYLVIARNYVWARDGVLQVVGGRPAQVKCWPEMTKGIAGFEKVGIDGEFVIYERSVTGEASKVTYVLAEETAETRTYDVEIAYGENLADCMLSVAYGGDGLKVYCDGEMVNDAFYTGQKLELSMRYFDFPKKLRIVVDALAEEAPIFLESWPKMTDGRACEIVGIEAVDYG